MSNVVLTNEEILAIVRDHIGEDYLEDVECITLDDIFMEEECEEEYSFGGEENGNVVKGSKVWYINTMNCIHDIAIRVYQLANELFLSFKLNTSYPDDICISI